MTEGAVESIELSVGSNLEGFQMEIWTMVPEIYELSVVSPTGERFPKTVVRPEERQEYVFLFEKTKLTAEYAIVGTRNSMQLIMLRFERPLSGNQQNIFTQSTKKSYKYTLQITKSGS